MKLIRLFGAMILLVTAMASCAPKYGCYSLTDATIQTQAADAPAVSLEICAD